MILSASFRVVEMGFSQMTPRDAGVGGVADRVDVQVVGRRHADDVEVVGLEHFAVRGVLWHGAAFQLGPVPERVQHLRLEVADRDQIELVGPVVSVRVG